MGQRLCVIGAGPMGVGIAYVAALAGYDVELDD
jgi:3-hydroxyacyl-CoA dehydrogenase